jgi:hypothetical protein
LWHSCRIPPQRAGFRFALVSAFTKHDSVYFHRCINTQPLLMLVEIPIGAGQHLERLKIISNSALSTARAFLPTREIYPI